MQDMEQNLMDMEEPVELEESKKQYLIFSIDNECFGVNINCVIEIISMEPITIVPDLPEYIKGVINLRGRVIPVMDIRIRFAKERKAYTDRTCIIVVEVDRTFMGLIIDQVVEVIDIEEESIMPQPKNGKERDSITNRYIMGLAKKGNAVRLLVDTAKLLEKEEN